MQYLLHDLIKLPLNQRLAIIEKVITAAYPGESESDTKNTVTAIQELSEYRQ